VLARGVLAWATGASREIRLPAGWIGGRCYLCWVSGRPGHVNGDPGWGDQGWGDQGWGDQGWGDQGWGDQGWGDQGWGDQGWGDRGWGDSRIVLGAGVIGLGRIEAGLAGFLRRRDKHERAAFQLYGAAVAAARDPFLYRDLGVPDTLDGRFDAIGLHVYLLIRRLNTEAEPGPALAQAVFDAMFLDMDINLREMGVGDMSVGKRNRAMWEAFHGRSAAYSAVWDDPPALEAAFARNFWRGVDPPAGSAASLVRLARARAAHLAGQRLDPMLRGEVRFFPAEEVAR
jgi:cytochrome b pre-mRNA-processing protein 3